MTLVSAIITGQQPYTATNEGCRLEAYQDTMGIWTVGFGHAHVEPGTVWSQSQADAQLKADLQSAANSLSVHAPWWTNLDAPRAGVLLDMCFNLGAAKFLTWHHTLGYAQSGDYEKCGEEILASEPWASEVGNRAVRNANQMKTGVYQTEPANG